MAPNPLVCRLGYMTVVVAMAEQRALHAGDNPRPDDLISAPPPMQRPSPGAAFARSAARTVPGSCWPTGTATGMVFAFATATCGGG